ncbi:uncharacterized protein LOC127130182 [Lathyrus oleraceus]|uniref:uncharacterized protein LOC127130182 n=1 Tax=Pisum sativum TaxID=3888 RepID=UPI0021CF0161|nr:uncharacterized protein LOC127130182 [Pisum sativum]
MQLRVFGSVIGSKEKALRNAFHAQKQVCPVRCYLLESLEADILSPSSLQKQNSEAPFDVDSKMKIDATAAVEIVQQSSGVLSEHDRNDLSLYSSDEIGFAGGAV